jgi:hypothetical protein
MAVSYSDVPALTPSLLPAIHVFWCKTDLVDQAAIDHHFKTVR